MNIGIIGLGLMGSSMALALKKFCNNISIYGYDQNSTNLDYVVEKNIIDERLKESTYPKLDMIFLAVPVGRIIDVITAIIPYLDKENTLLTDMGSTKAYICQEINKRFPEINFIGGHPITGREVSGPTGAYAKLFANMTYVLIEPNKIDKRPRLIKKQNKLLKLLDAISAKVIFMDAERHDKLVALTSHLPHFIATSFINQVMATEKEYPELNQMMGQGFRDFTRIAASNPKMWRDIFLTNRKNIIKEIDKSIEQMLIFRNLIDKKDEKLIVNFIDAAQKKKNNLDEKFKKVSEGEL